LAASPISDAGFKARDPLRRLSVIRAAIVLLLLAACSYEKPPKQAVNEMIESPLQNTVISSFDTYPPKPLVVREPESDLMARGEHEERFWVSLPL